MQWIFFFFSSNRFSSTIRNWCMRCTGKGSKNKYSFNQIRHGVIFNSTKRENNTLFLHIKYLLFTFCTDIRHILPVQWTFFNMVFTIDARIHVRSKPNFPKPNTTKKGKEHRFTHKAFIVAFSCLVFFLYFANLQPLKGKHS